MKKTLIFFICVVLFVSSFPVEIYANNNYVSSFSELSTENLNEQDVAENVRASGLIVAVGLTLSKTGTTLHLFGETLCATGVVTCGFKNLTVERRKSSDDSWEDYHEFGNVYRDATGAVLDTTLVVPAGYQYRLSCKHYAKKSLFVTQSISNTSNIVTVS